MAAPPANVSDWIATAAPLMLGGSNAIVSSDNSIVQRQNIANPYCLCYTSRPLPPGKVWQITILETTTWWRRSGLVGLYIVKPELDQK